MKYPVACPTCGAGPGQHCRTLSGTNRITDTHVARFDGPNNPAVRALTLVADDLQQEALLASRPGQHDRLDALSQQVVRIARGLAEVAK